MAKQIMITPDKLEEIIAKLRAEVEAFGCQKCDGSVKINQSFVVESGSREATLAFTPSAWAKMTALVACFETEVQWHGTINRTSETSFLVTDILVPPHEVGAATVTSEYEPYEKWLDALDDDTFNQLHFHGHSHVNMSVSPSSVDQQYRKDNVTLLPNPTGDNDIFYVFFIMNKKYQWSAEIYDVSNNVLYDTDEINLSCCVGDVELNNFVMEAKKVAVPKTCAMNISTKADSKKEDKKRYRFSSLLDDYYTSLSDEERDW